MAIGILIALIIVLLFIIGCLLYKQKQININVEHIDTLLKEPLPTDGHNSQWFEGFKAGVKWGFKAGSQLSS